MEEQTQYAIYRVQSKDAGDSRVLDVPFLLFKEEESAGGCRRTLFAPGASGIKLTRREAPCSPFHAKFLPILTRSVCVTAPLQLGFEFASALWLDGSITHQLDWLLIVKVGLLVTRLTAIWLFAAGSN